MRLGQILGVVVACLMATSAGAAVIAAPPAAPAAAAATTTTTPTPPTYTTTITSTVSLGKVTSGGSGDTVFTIDPATGVVTRSSGSGVRLATTTTRAAVSVKCGNQSSCDDTYVLVLIGSTGSPTKRARPLTNFTVAMNTAKQASGGFFGSPLAFALFPIPKNTTKTFYVGFDYPIAGDDSGIASGASGAGFYVYSGPLPNIPNTGDSDTATATVYRPISITNPTGLVFGTVVRPRAVGGTGTGTVAVNASTGARTFTGDVVLLASPTPSRATYAVTGEGGQALSISIPTSMVLSTSGGTITVTLTNTATGSKVLSSSAGSAGSYGFNVGGSLPLTKTTATGAYTGTFAVMVQYN